MSESRLGLAASCGGTGIYSERQAGKTNRKSTYKFGDRLGGIGGCTGQKVNICQYLCHYTCGFVNQERSYFGENES
jgi:hypothetical protein